MLDAKSWPENLASSCHNVREFAVIFRELMVCESDIGDGNGRLELWEAQLSVGLLKVKGELGVRSMTSLRNRGL